MFNDVIFLIVLIVVLFIIWLALKMNIKVKQQRVKEVKSLNLGNYVTYVHNYNLAEEEERKGNTKLAIINYRKALKNLEDEEHKDQMLLETIDEVKAKLKELGADDE